MDLRRLMMLGLALVALGGEGCGDDDDDTSIDEIAGGNIVEIASSSDDFDTLTAALTTADLTATLSGPGPYTVFAPTDDAFDRLPDGTLENLSQEELRTILLYHVVPGQFLSDDLTAGPIDTAADFTAFVSNGNAIAINQVRVIDADIEASNGVIHAIDGVLTPPDMIQGLTLAGDFDTLLGALSRAGLTDDLQGPGPFTIFAPTDEAFDALPEGTLEGLSQQQLQNVLLYHVVNERVIAGDLSEGAVDTMLSGEQVNVDLSDGGVQVGDARVVTPDLLVTNGVIHAIDAVLLP